MLQLETEGAFNEKSHPNNAEGEILEGLDDQPNQKVIGWEEYPIDSVFIRTEIRTIKETLARIKSGRYVMDPELQRNFLWSPKTQSKLIESCIMRIPLPVFYVAENQNGLITIVDGLQRLSTLKNFFERKLKLTGLGKKHPLNKMTIKDLPPRQLAIIEDTHLLMYVIDSRAPEIVKLDIFERVNSGTPLSRQQMRNALYNGPATDWLKKAVSGKIFQKATNSSLDKNSMRDREAINRFVSFSLLNWKNYKNGKMDSFLAEGLIELNETSKTGRDKLLEKFFNSMNFNYILFQEEAFRRSIVLRKSERTPINISLFDVLSVTLSKICKNKFDEFKSEIKDIIKKTIRNDEFLLSITHSTNREKAVRHRFYILEEALEKFYG